MQIPGPEVKTNLDSLVGIKRLCAEFEIPIYDCICDFFDFDLEFNRLLIIIKKSNLNDGEKIFYLTELWELVGSDAEQVGMIEDYAVELSLKNPCAFKQVRSKLDRHFFDSMLGGNLVPESVDSFYKVVDSMKCQN